MSVLVKGIKMPKCCAECFVDTFECDKHYDVDIWERRHQDCPLIEIHTPHGRLIDADKLMVEIIDRDIDHLQRDDCKEMVQVVIDSQTVVEEEV